MEVSCGGHERHPRDRNQSVKKVNSDHHTYKQPTVPPPELVRVLDQPVRDKRALEGGGEGLWEVKGCGQERRWLILGCALKVIPQPTEQVLSLVRPHSQYTCNNQVNVRW